MELILKYDSIKIPLMINVIVILFTGLTIFVQVYTHYYPGAIYCIDFIHLILIPSCHSIYATAAF